MIKPLRKRHLQIWIAWAFLIPVGIVMAWLVIPNLQPVKLLHPESQKLLPILYKSADKTNYWVNIRTNEGKNEWQLEWINKYTLSVPSAVVYRRINNIADITQSELIGRIEARDSYVFPLKEYAEETTFFLYDFIHEKIIDSIILKTPQ
jgi:hypothetical protein